MVETAAIAANRVAVMLKEINASYSPQTPLSTDRGLRLEDAMLEIQTQGHIYDANCTSEFCQRAGLMIQTALAQMGAQ